MTEAMLCIRLTLAALASYRLARLLALEAGPMFMLAWLRKRLAKRSELLGALFECPLCLGVWLSFALWPFVFLPYGEVLLAPLAIAGAQCALQLATDHDLDAGDQTE